MKRCRDCKWWNQDRAQEGDVTAHCVRFPPTLVHGWGAMGRWPKTQPTDGCGEWAEEIPSEMPDLPTT